MLGPAGRAGAHEPLDSSPCAHSRRNFNRGLILVDPTFLSPEREREVRDSDVAEQTLLVIGDSPGVSLEMATDLQTINPRVRIEQVERS